MTVAGGCLAANRTGDPHIFDCIMTEMLFSYVNLMKPGPPIVFWAQTGATPWPTFQWLPRASSQKTINCRLHCDGCSLKKETVFSECFHYFIHSFGAHWNVTHHFHLSSLHLPWHPQSGCRGVKRRKAFRKSNRPIYSQHGEK